jgi:hypothetical protein
MKVQPSGSAKVALQEEMNSKRLKINRDEFKKTDQEKIKLKEMKQLHKKEQVNKTNN